MMYIRMIGSAALLAVMFWLMLCVSAFAQDTPAQDSAQTSTTAAKTVTTPTASLNLDDPAIQAALDARAEADKALVEALRAQQAQVAEVNLAPVTRDDTAPKTSLLPKNAEDAKARAQAVIAKLQGWLTSVTFLAQLGAIIGAAFLAPLLARALRKRIPLFRDPPQSEASLYPVRDYTYRAGAFLRAVILVALLAAAGAVLKASLGQDWLVKIALGLAVVFLLFRAIKTFIAHDLVRKLALWIIIPLAVLMVFGFFDDFVEALRNLKLGQGDSALSALTLILLAFFGTVFFKIATISNAKGADAIRSQDALDVTTREVVAKILQIVLFAAATIMAFAAAGVSLSGLVVIFSALSLGVGLGLQPIAANFVSGLIILFDRSVKVGDFVMMGDEKFGRVSAINMRSTTITTADGKDIIVPNTQFTEDAYENWTHDSPLQRYEVDFLVSYDTDLDALVPIIRDSVLEHKDVLGEPDLPSVEFRAFGDSGINMCVEFWCKGVDDGPNKFTSDVGFIIWRTLKANQITIPFPQRDVHMVDRPASKAGAKRSRATSKLS